MGALATIGLVATSVVGGLIGASAELEAGKAAERAGEQQQALSEFEARQAEINAGQERASAQRAAMEERRRARLIQSRQQAVAGASGAGALDPTVLDLQADAEAEGEYGALTRLYAGEEAARGYRMQAAGSRYEGQVARYAGKVRRNASYSRAIGAALPSVLDAGTTLYDRSVSQNSLYGRYG